MTYKEIDLCEGKNEPNSEGGFCPDLMEQAGVDNMYLCKTLAKVLTPFAGLLKDGFGFAVTVDDEEASVIGLKKSTELHDAVTALYEMGHWSIEDEWLPEQDAAWERVRNALGRVSS